MKNLLKPILTLLATGLCLPIIKADQPNILFMLTDDHAVQSIGCMGTIFEDLDPTPNLDKLASEGVIFRNTFVTNSICSPSRAGILTGKYSHLNGVRAWEEFDGSQQTMPKLLQSAGYHTVLIGKWHLKTKPTGFSDWIALPGQGEYYNPTFLTEKNYKDNPLQMKGYVGEIITRLAEAAIRKRPKDKPLAIFVNHKSVHTPFLCDMRDKSWLEDVILPEPATLRDTWEGRPAIPEAHNRVPNIEMTHKRFDQNGVRKPGKHNYRDEKEQDMSIQERNVYRYQFYMKSYLRTARSIDRSMGELMEILEDEGMSDNTAVVYMSDQGFYLGEHGMGDKRWAYEESMRTPLIMKLPGGIRGGEVNELALNIDMASTLLSIAGEPIPHDMQGLDLTPFLKGEKPKKWREQVYYRYYDAKGYNIAMQQAVRTADHKLIYFPEAKRYELFDLNEDPVEMNNLATNPEYASLLNKMKQRLAKARNEVGDTDPDLMRVR